MYVEISGRQTGKTTRLVDHMVSNILDHTDQPYRICLIVRNSGNARHIRSMVARKLNEHIHHIGLSDRYPNNIDVKYSMYDAVGYDYYYLDEFDFLRDPILYRDNAYYTTTPGNNHTAIGLIEYCQRLNIPIISYQTNDNLREQFNNGYFGQQNDQTEFDRICDLYGIEPTNNQIGVLTKRIGYILQRVTKHRFK